MSSLGSWYSCDECSVTLVGCKPACFSQYFAIICAREAARGPGIIRTPTFWFKYYQSSHSSLCLTYPHFWFSLQSFQLRNALVPYIYTAARTAYATGILLVHPLYYEWPDLDAAYSFSQLRGPGIPIQHMYFALIKHPGPFLVPTHCFL